MSAGGETSPSSRFWTARRNPGRENTYWTAVFHNLFPETLQRLTSD